MERNRRINRLQDIDITPLICEDCGKKCNVLKRTLGRDGKYRCEECDKKYKKYKEKMKNGKG